MFGRCIRLTLWLASALAVGGYLAFVMPRLFAVQAQDSFEVALLDHAVRIARGAAVFRASGGSDLALMPGFPYVLSGLVRMFDPQLWEPRLVAVLATILTAALVAVVVRSETRSITLGVASAGLMLMGQGLLVEGPAGSGPGSLMLLLVLASFLELRGQHGIKGTLFSALFMSAACLTHVDGVWFAMAALLYLVVHDRKVLVIFAAGLGVFLGGGHVALSIGLGPWFNFYAWQVPLSALSFEPIALLRFIGTQLFGTLGVLILATVLSFALPRAPWRGAPGVWTWVGLAAIAAGILGTQSTLAQSQALRSAVVALAILGPISIQRVTHHLAAWPGSSRLGGESVVLTALVLQFIMILAQVAPIIQ